jgi:hypothetical protein
MCDWYSLNHMNIASVYEDNPLFDRQIESATSDLKLIYKKILQRVSKKIATVYEYVMNPYRI